MRLLVVATGAWLLVALACGGKSPSRTTTAAPDVAGESPQVDPGNGEPGDDQQLPDSLVMAEPGSAQPESLEPESSEPAANPPPPDAPQLTPTEIADIKALLIQASIEAYDGSCPCPYNEARDGSSCGGRSAYSRAGGEHPLCYPEDVSDEMVYKYWVSMQ